MCTCVYVAGAIDGEEWVWEDQYEIYHIRQLHCQRYQEAGGYK